MTKNINWEEPFITNNVEEKNNMFLISNGAWVYCFAKKDLKHNPPKKGDEIQLCFSEKHGGLVKGIKINGNLTSLKSDEQLDEICRARRAADEARRIQMAAEDQAVKEQIIKEFREKEIKKRWDAYQTHAQQDYEALPPYFKRQIDRARNEGLEYQMKIEADLMFVCQESLKIAKALKTPEAIEKYQFVNPKFRTQDVPELSTRLSTSFFVLACQNAIGYLKEQDTLNKVVAAQRQNQGK